MTAELDRHDCPNCDPTPAVSTETVRGGRRLGTPADHDHPVPDPAAHAQARYDTDPDALAWARTKVQHQLDRLAAFEQHATETGQTEKAAGLSAARRSTEQMLLGGSGCVVGAFDARRPRMFGTPSDVDGGV